MNEIDKKFLESWAEARNIPFMEDDYPMLDQLIKAQGKTVIEWCEQQDKQQADIDKNMK